MRRRVVRSARRSRSLAIPPSCTHEGIRLSILVLPAWYGIDVAGHVDAAGAGLVDETQNAVHLAPVLASAHLDVGDLHADAALLADADGLADGVLHHRALAAHVGEVEAAAPGHRAGQRDQLRR